MTRRNKFGLRFIDVLMALTDRKYRNVINARWALFCADPSLQVRGKTIKTKISVFDTFFFSFSVPLVLDRLPAPFSVARCPQRARAHTNLEVAPRELFKHLQHGQSGLI